MRREDLRVLLPPPAWDTLLLSPQRTRHVEAAELAELIESMGYVKVPDCEECGGEGMVDWSLAMDSPRYADCPSCGGTGRQRMVAVGDARRIKMCSQSGERMWGDKCAFPDDDPCEPMYVWLIRGLEDGHAAHV